MTFGGSILLAVSLICAVAAALAIALFRLPRAKPPGSRLLRAAAWLLLAGGTGVSGLLTLALFTGRFGPEHFWFREPAFFIAIAVLACALMWWLRRPESPVLRWGLPTALAVLAVAGVLLGHADGRATPLSMSMPTRAIEAPALTYVDGEGRARSIAELRGKVVLLNFWATWCTPCRREMPLLAKLQREHAADGLVVLFVSLEEPAVLDPFLAAHRFDGVQGRLLHAADYYGAGRFYPLSYLISREGRVAERWSGRPREDWLASRLGELL